MKWTGRQPRSLVRATDDEVERWRADAERGGVSLSDHVRRALDVAPHVAQAVEMLARARGRTGFEDELLRLLDPVRWEKETR